MRYRTILALAALAMAVPANSDSRKLTFEERVELVRGLMAEYATVKTALPRSKKPLPYDTATFTWDKEKWDEAGREFGPAARVGDLVQITKVEIENDKILLEINGGLKSGRKWYQRIEVGMGNRTSPVSSGQGTNAPGGTNLAVLFPKGVQPIEAADFKKLLKPIMDFEKRTATENYVDTLPPAIQTAIKEKKPIEGMDREQVRLALGAPRHKTREIKDGIELEDWIYGQPPGKITFVTFEGSKVVRVKDNYAGLGGSIADPLPPQ
jgi:hypothetical protein